MSSSLCRDAAEIVVVDPLIRRIPDVFGVAYATDALHFPTDGLYGTPHLRIGHLIHVHCLHHLGHAKAYQRIFQPVEGKDTTDADEQGVVVQIAGHVAFQRPLRDIGAFTGGVAGDVRP